MLRLVETFQKKLKKFNSLQTDTKYFFFLSRSPYMKLEAVCKKIAKKYCILSSSVEKSRKSERAKDKALC